MRYNADALWNIVHKQCAVNADHHPCKLYNAEKSYSLLKDKKGYTHYLLIPTVKITGIEDDILLDPKTPNFFQYAWDNRDYVRKSHHQNDLPDEALSLAVNSVLARSQNQLHIHIDCLRKDVLEDLNKLSWPFNGEHVKLGHGYYNISSLTSLEPSPFLSYAHQTKKERGYHGLAIIYRGENKFLLLEDVVTGLDFGEAEYLQDHQCRKSRMEMKSPP